MFFFYKQFLQGQGILARSGTTIIGGLGFLPKNSQENYNQQWLGRSYYKEDEDFEDPDEISESARNHSKSQSEKRKKKKAFFSYLISFAQIVVMIAALSAGGVQSVKTNPVIGPPNDTLVQFGAKNKNLRNEWWRFFTPMIIHPGIAHIIIILYFQLSIGRKFEKTIGLIRYSIIYIISGVGGILWSALFLPNFLLAGASMCSLFGIAGAITIDLFQNWKVIKNKIKKLLFTLIILLCGFIIGMLPMLDNFANFGGLITGILTSIVILPYIGIGKKRRIFVLIGFVLLFLWLFFGFWFWLNNKDATEWCSSCKYINCIETFNWCTTS